LSGIPTGCHTLKRYFYFVENLNTVC
jgi:hypothetical protein